MERLEPPRIFDYECPRSYLQDYSRWRKAKNPRLSLRGWARSMELSHTQLSFLLNGKRRFKSRHITLLTKGISLDEKERLYLQVMIQLSQLSDSQEESDLRQVFLDQLDTLKKH